MQLILASRSPQRRAILAQAGIDFTAVTPEVQELTAGEPEAVTLENARRKAEAVAAAHPGSLVLGVDTVVWCGGRIYGKPPDENGARGVLRTLSGRTHTVLSGMCLLAGSRGRTAVTRTEVHFRTLDDALIDWYLAIGEWHERAGAYAIQGHGAVLVRAIEGDYLNVVGLPLVTLLEIEPAILALG